MEIEPIYFSHFACLQSKVSYNILEQLKKDAEYILENENKFKKYNNDLVGNIEKEYSVHISEEILRPDLITLANEYYKYSKEDENYPDWNTKDIWINYQKKYEHNPIHNHSGDLSFVLWVTIPYDLKEELELPNSKNSNSPTNSLFHFVYTDFLGKIVYSPIHIDKSWEGTIVMFPSSLNHMVYPFYTSDEYRISIAGNLNAIPPRVKTTLSYR
jgi:hypothetical protein